MSFKEKFKLSKQMTSKSGIVGVAVGARHIYFRQYTDNIIYRMDKWDGEAEKYITNVPTTREGGGIVFYGCCLYWFQGKDLYEADLSDEKSPKVTLLKTYSNLNNKDLDVRIGLDYGYNELLMLGVGDYTKVYSISFSNLGEEPKVKFAFSSSIKYGTSSHYGANFCRMGTNMKGLLFGGSDTDEFRVIDLNNASVVESTSVQELGCCSIEGIALDPVNQTDIYISDDSNGIYKLTGSTYYISGYTVSVTSFDKLKFDSTLLNIGLELSYSGLVNLNEDTYNMDIELRDGSNKLIFSGCASSAGTSTSPEYHFSITKDKFKELLKYCGSKLTAKCSVSYKNGFDKYTNYATFSGNTELVEINTWTGNLGVNINSKRVKVDGNVGVSYSAVNPSDLVKCSDDSKVYYKAVLERE